MTSDLELSGVHLAVTASALEGDAASIYHIVRDLLGNGMPFEAVIVDVLAPVQAALGERWQGGDYLISEEHAATGAIETVVALLVGSFEQPEEGTRVVVSCVEGDEHSLAGRMLSALLLARGFRTTYLGATMPAADLGRFLAEDPPDALVLTCAMSSHLSGALAAVAAGHAAGVPVLVGGEAFGDQGEWAERVGADGWVPTLQAAVDLLESWDPMPASAASAAEPPELAKLVAARPAVVAAAAVAAAGTRAESSRFFADLELIFDGLLATLVAGDDRVLSDLMKWLGVRLENHGDDTATAAALLSALRTALGEDYAEAAEHLTRVAAGL